MKPKPSTGSNPNPTPTPPPLPPKPSKSNPTPTPPPAPKPSNISPPPKPKPSNSGPPISPPITDKPIDEKTSVFGCLYQWAMAYNHILIVVSNAEFNSVGMMKIYKGINLVPPNCSDFKENLAKESEKCKIIVDHFTKTINEIPWDIMTFGIQHAMNHMAQCGQYLEVAYHFCSNDMVKYTKASDLLMPLKAYSDPKHKKKIT